MNFLTILLVVGIDDAIVLGLFSLLAQVITFAVDKQQTKEETERATTRAEQFAISSTEDEREYNLYTNEKQRMMDAGATEGGALASILGSSPYYSPGYQSVPPQSNAGNIASLASSLMQSFGGVGETMRDVESARNMREMLPINKREAEKRIDKMASDMNWTDQQIESSRRILKITEDKYAYEIRNMQVGYVDAVNKIMLAWKQYELDTRVADSSISVNDATVENINADTSLKNATAANVNADTALKKLDVTIKNVSAEYAKNYHIVDTENPLSLLVQLLLSPDLDKLTTDVVDNGKKLANGLNDVVNSVDDNKVDKDNDSSLRNTFDVLPKVVRNIINSNLDCFNAILQSVYRYQIGDSFNAPIVSPASVNAAGGSWMSP